MISIQTQLSVLVVLCFSVMTNASHSLRWGGSITKSDWVWHTDVVVPNLEGWNHILYVDQIQDGKNREILGPVYIVGHHRGEVSFRLNLPDSVFRGNTRIITARVEYHNGETLYSSELNLKKLNLKKSGWILGAVFGGIGFAVILAVLVGCVCRRKRRERRKQRNLFNPTTQGVPTLVQAPINQVPTGIPTVPTTGQHVVEVAPAPPMYQMPQAQTNGLE